LDDVGLEVHQFGHDRSRLLIHDHQVLPRLLSLLVRLCGRVNTDQLALLVKQPHIPKDLQVLVEFEVFGLQQLAHFAHFVVAELVHLQLDVRKQKPTHKQAASQHIDIIFMTGAKVAKPNQPCIIGPKIYVKWYLSAILI
jgi:hypothetical protein